MTRKIKFLLFLLFIVLSGVLFCVIRANIVLAHENKQLRIRNAMLVEEIKDMIFDEQLTIATGYVDDKQELYLGR